MRARSAFFVTLLLFASPLLYAQSNQASERDAFIDPFGKEIRVRVMRNRVGAVVTDSERAKRIVASGALRELKLVAADTRSSSELLIFTFADRRARKREELLATAARLRRIEGVQQAGLIVFHENGRLPALMTNHVSVQLDAKERRDLDDTGMELRVVIRNPFTPGHLLVAAGDQDDALRVSEKLRATRGVRFAVPDFIVIKEERETIPADPLFGSQWHLRNTGASGGTAGADSRATFAWDLTTGNAARRIMINELNGFDLAHEDLTANLWVNPGETPGNGIDDDGNGLIDDINGWDFSPCPMAGPNGCGDNTPSASGTQMGHATSVAGVAAARSGNALGGSGSCPNCTWVATRVGPSSSDFVTSLTFDYARVANFDVVNNSWGWGGGPMQPTTAAAIANAAANGRGGLGTVIFYAAGNSNVDPCTGVNLDPYVSQPGVIPISSASNRDRRVQGHAFGNCIAALAPTRWSPNDPMPTGTLAITTTDRTGTDGYNSSAPATCIGGLVEPADTNYTNCFSGTSSASPLTSGVAGLVLSANNTLTQQQLRNALQDTADKIEDSLGSYVPATGKSSPGGGTATHAYGRINAFEAVRLVAPAAHNGTDIFLRDNRLDWGNTDQPSNVTFEPVRGFIPHWQSVDIKVDQEPFAAAPANNAQFEAFTHENAESGSPNKVYVRVRNRGPVSATNVQVRLYWAFAGAGLPSLPPMFWDNFPAPTPSPNWTLLGTQNIPALAYSGASVANSAGDAAQIVTFDFPGPPLGTLGDIHHFCLFAVIDSDQDRPLPKTRPPVASDLIPDHLTPRDNNVTHRNIQVFDNELSDASESFTINNPTAMEVTTIVRVLAPKGVKVAVEGLPVGERIQLKPHERRVAKVRITRTASTPGEVTIVQEIFAGKEHIVGGMTYRFERKRK